MATGTSRLLAWWEFCGTIQPNGTSYQWSLKGSVELQFSSGRLQLGGPTAFRKKPSFRTLAFLSLFGSDTILLVTVC
jgi:hypothetical protein